MRRLLAMARQGLAVLRSPLAAAAAIVLQCAGWFLQLLAVYVALVVVGQLIAGASQKDSNEAAAGGMLVLAGMIVNIVASFSIRRSMIDYYNKVGPTALRLSAALTLILGAIYLQYHMTRIAGWKQTAT